MIKYLGSIGTFIRLNDNENKAYKLLEVFSSSAASNRLFSASVNNLSGTVSFDSASTILYINGVSGSVLPSQQWSHMTFSFNNKLYTETPNNFLIKFGDSASSNFNIQNMYILENSFTDNDISYLHKEFTGAGNILIQVTDTASFSIGITDAPENNFISASTNTIYQPLRGQTNYLCDVAAMTEDSLSKFVSASTMINDDLYIDSFNIQPGNKVFSLADNQIYELTASSKLLPISSSEGDFIKVLSGRYFGNSVYQKYAGQVLPNKFIVVGTALFNASSSAIFSNDQITWTQSPLPFSDWSTANIYQSGSFILISPSGSVAVSTDGLNWTTNYIDAGYLGSNYFKGITYGNGVFVTALSNGSYFYVSNDGLNWYSSSYIGITGTWSKVGYGNGIFMAISGEYFNDNEVVISTDGINWTLLGDPPAIGKTWNKPAFGDNEWLIVANGPFNAFHTSSNNGVTWTSQTYPYFPPVSNFLDPIYASNKFIVSPNSSNFTDFIYYSLDGINWQTASIGTVGAWQDINYNVNGFTLLSSFYGMEEGKIVTSIDGINWSSSVALLAFPWFGIVGNTESITTTGFKLTASRQKIRSYVNRIQ